MKKITDNKFIKLICGAGNENLKEVEALSYVYALAGFNMIDVAAKNDVINAAIEGIKRAGKEKEVEICVSIGLQNDIHLTKAVINKQKCINCGKCINICPQNAIFEEDEQIQINEKYCIGCLKCTKVCTQAAIITEHKYKTPCSMLLSVLSENIDCVEFHCSSEDENLIQEAWSQIKSVYTGRLGFCIDRSKFGNDKLITVIRNMLQEDNEIIIQADGKPMSGGADDYNSNIQAIAFAELINGSGITSPVIVSGGTNSKTAEFAKICGVKINGVAIGSYARKLIKQEISSADFFDKKELISSAVTKVSELANSIKKYL